MNDPSSTNERLFGPSESLDIDLLKHGKTEFFNQVMEFYLYFTVSLKKKNIPVAHSPYTGNIRETWITRIVKPFAIAPLKRVVRHC